MPRFCVKVTGTCTRVARHGWPFVFAPDVRAGALHMMGPVTPSPRRLRAVALAALASIALLGCNSGTPLTQGPRLAKDQTLRVLLDDQPRTLDPGQTQYLYETAVLRAISEPLLKPTADMNGVVPAAAESFDVSANGTVFVFHLRPAAQYWTKSLSGS